VHRRERLDHFRRRLAHVREAMRGAH
jgi:hypothetical protein